jgi:hypothetical protein
MNELEDAWENDEDFWDFVGQNKRIIGLEISDNQGLDILSALRDIYTTIEKSPDSAMRMLTLLGITIYASSIGEGKKFTDEIQVTAAMEQFDTSIREILDEESK